MGVFIIAEAGVNHNGSLELAFKLIDVAARAGADAVKFQTFKADKVASSFAEKAEYQKDTTDPGQSHLDMLKHLELSSEAYVRLKTYAEDKGLVFMSTPFDIESARFLRDLGMEIFKISSGDITNYFLLKEIASYRKKVILSTGMSTLGEVESALEVFLSWGLRREDIRLLHCTTEYPSPYECVNLLAMQTMRRAFDVEVGYSDHTMGIEIAIAAVALGAQVIEKHFTLDKSLPGPDHRASLEPDELEQMVKAIRNVEDALGDGVKRPAECELKNINVARRSLFAARDISKGEPFSTENIIALRPGTGLSPMLWPKIEGKRALKDYKRGQPIEFFS